MRGASRLVAAVSVLLVAAILAFWWARTGDERATAPSRTPDAESPGPAPAPEGTAAADAGQLIVSVRDAGSGAPLAGAAVVAEPWNGTRTEAATDADGEAALPFVTGKVTARHRGYAPECERVGLATRRLIFLLRPGFPVRGRVVHAVSKEGIEHASVVATDIDAAETIAKLSTDHEGRFEIPGVAPDAPFLVTAERPGVPPAGRVERRADRDREIVLELGGAAVIEGRVLRADGSLAAGAKVDVRPRGGEDLLPDDLPFAVPDYEAETRTDALGAFRVEGLRVPASYEIKATDDRLSMGRAEGVDLRTEGQSAWREIRLVARTTVHVCVEFPPGEPWPHPGVALRHGGDDVPTQGGAINEDGWTWDVKTLGSHEVLVVDSAWPTTRIPVEVQEGFNEVIVHMTREGHRVVSGRVVNEDGTPLGGADIDVVFNPSDGGFRTFPADDGTFHVCDVPDTAGTLEVRDRTGVHSSWSRAEVRPGARLEIVLRTAARFVGRIDPAPATRRIAVRRVNQAHWPPDTTDMEIGTWLVSTDEQGRFDIPWSPGRPISLAFDASDAAPIFLDEPALAEGEIRDLGVLRLGPGRTAEGTVVDDGGNPVADCRLKLEMQFGRRGTWLVSSGPDIDDRWSYTTPGGRFRFNRLPEASLSLEATAAGFVPLTLDLPTVNDLQGLEVRLVPTALVEGVLADASGHPVAGKSVECVAPGRDEPFWGRTDSLGRFRIVVAPGKYRLKCDDQEGPSVEVRARETTRAEFRLQ